MRSKGQISLNFNYHVNFKDFLHQTLCVFSQKKDTKTYQTGFSFWRLGHAPGVGLGGTGGAQGVKKNFLFKHGHVAYQIDGDVEQNRIQVKFSSKSQTGDLWVKRSIIIKFQSPCQF